MLVQKHLQDSVYGPVGFTSDALWEQKHIQKNIIAGILLDSGNVMVLWLVNSKCPFSSFFEVPQGPSETASEGWDGPNLG